MILCSILSSSSFSPTHFQSFSFFHKHVFKVQTISPAHLQSFKSGTVLTVYFIVSRYSNLVNGILQTGVHTLRNKFWKVEYLFLKTCKGVRLRHCNVFFQNWLFSTDFSEIWPHRRKLWVTWILAAFCRAFVLKLLTVKKENVPGGGTI